MNLLEAYEKTKEGRKIRRDDWSEGYYIVLFKISEEEYIFRTQSEHFYSFSNRDFEASWHLF